MSFSKLPFDILGQVGPILAWVESDDGGPLPDTWTSVARPVAQRESGWLSGELPTYSRDTIDEIVIGTRFRHRRKSKRPAQLPFLEDSRRPELEPPYDYDLLRAFRRLNDHFLIWNGTEPCIRAGLMEELHELGLRLPAGHIVRHGHAHAVAQGIISFEDALALPESITYLPSNSFGLRNVVKRGLSESHLHLKGVTSAEETWADSLLRPVSAGSIRGGSPEERRLLILNLFAGRILAIAVWMSLFDRGAETRVRPALLLRLLDRLYFARSHYEEGRVARQLEAAIRDGVYGKAVETDGSDTPGAPQTQGEPTPGPSSTSRGRLDSHWSATEARTRKRLAATAIAQRVDPRYQFLLRWISPTIWRIARMSEDSQGLAGNLPESLDHRLAMVHRLHLAAHLRLIRLSSRDEKSRSGAGIGPLEGKGGRKDALGSARSHQDPRRYFLHRALFRYLVCRTHHWQMATQQGQTTGLRHFKRYFDAAQRRPRDMTSLQQAELVFDRLRHWRGLRVVEGRVSPPGTSQDLVPWVLAYARPEDRRVHKFGMVVHFKKESEDQEDRVLSSRQGSPALRLRWGRRRRRVRDEGMRLYRLLRRPTPITPFIVGIDACNLELATPPEVFAPVFRFLRELPIALQGDSRYFSPYAPLDDSIRALVGSRRLGMTYHVGEDFRHLLSGLRAICEVVDFLGPNPGDRLGHGTALALSPEKWLEHNGFQAVVPKLEWLDTLVWLHHFLGPGDNLVGELAIEDQIQRISWEIYSPAVAAHYDPLGVDERHVFRGRDRRRKKEPRPRGLLDWDWSPLTLWDAWQLRQLDPYSLDIAGLLSGHLRVRGRWVYTEEERRWQTVQERVMREVRRDIGSRNAYLILALYWLDSGVRERGNEVMVVQMKEQREQWLELCCRVEDRMKTLIHEKELVVEVNPSANRIIGPMASYDQHHIFQLTLDEDRRLSRQVRVSVNTDNPAVCNTTLAHEHYLVGEILIREGVPEAEVVNWLEWLRQNGQDYNFVRRLKSPEESPDMQRLLLWLRSIRKSVREARSREEKRNAFWSWLRDTRLRAHGFSPERIEKDPTVLERIVGLEERLRAAGEHSLDRSTHSGARTASDLDGRLDALEKLVGDLGLRTRTGPAA